MCTYLLSFFYWSILGKEITKTGLKKLQKEMDKRIKEWTNQELEKENKKREELEKTKTT